MFFWQRRCVTRSDKLQFPRLEERPVSGFGIRGTRSTLRFFSPRSFTTVADGSVPWHRLRCCLKELKCFGPVHKQPSYRPQKGNNPRGALWVHPVTPLSCLSAAVGDCHGLAFKGSVIVEDLFSMWVLSICFFTLRSCGVITSVKEGWFPSIDQLISETVLLNPDHFYQFIKKDL